MTLHDIEHYPFATKFPDAEGSCEEGTIVSFRLQFDLQNPGARAFVQSNVGTLGSFRVVDTLYFGESFVAQ